MQIKNNIHTMTGARVITNTLKLLGTDTIFGYPGGMVLDIYDELYNQDSIKHILVRHEQSAVHAAEGYARVSGKCGVVLVTSGPGATNTVTGIVNAYLDGYPLIVITGQVEKHLIGKNSFQEANICEITKTCTKAVFRVTDANDIRNTLCQAYKIAMSGKKGPVVIEMSKNIYKQNVQFEEDIKTDIKSEANQSGVNIKYLYDKILSSSRPVVVVGGGVNHSNAHEELYEFIHKLNLPFVSTMMGLGAFGSLDDNYIGMLGIFGDNSANQVIRESDFVISLGARFNDRITCMFKNDELLDKIVQIDINPDEISNNIKPIYSMCADIKYVLKSLNTINNIQNAHKYTDWLNCARKYIANNKKAEKQSNMLHSFEIFNKLEAYTKNMPVIFTSEVGQHQLWAVKGLKFDSSRKILLSGGSGTMGFGLPAAIGAAIASPDKTIVCICGDGSLQMSLGELSVCKDYGLNIKILVLNNGYLGMVRQLQEKNFDRHYSQTQISNPDFVKLSNSFGIEAIKVNCLNKVENALHKAFSTDKTYVIDFEIEPMEIL